MFFKGSARRCDFSVLCEGGWVFVLLNTKDKLLWGKFVFLTQCGIQKSPLEEKATEDV